MTSEECQTVSSRSHDQELLITDICHRMNIVSTELDTPTSNRGQKYHR